MSKCPYCYRNLGTWQKDPILIPTGAKYDWISDTELVYEPDANNRWYKGCQQICEPEVKELQDYLKNLEEEYLPEIDWTEFSPLNTSGKFQITGKHIKEMRDSVEKLLNAVGLTKIDYFNYDEEGNHIIHPNGDKLEWTDPITTASDLQKFQVKYIHIEDLRHYIQLLWIEKFFITSIGDLIDLDGYYDGQDELILTDEEYFNGDKGEWLAEGEVALTISAPLKPPGTNVNGYSEGSLNINISANDGESHLLNIAAEGEAYCSTSYVTGAITGWARRKVSMDDSNIAFQDFINQRLKSTTYIDMTSEATLSDDSKCGISCEITFGSGRSIEYVYGRQIHSETANREIKTLLDFTNLNLPIYTDYIAKWGVLPLGETVAGVNFYIAFSLSADMGNTVSVNMSAFATKIAVRNS